MQKKIRELKDILQKAGFIHHSSKGIHTRLVHPLLKNEPITITGKDEDKIKTYMAKEVSHKLEMLKIIENQDSEE
ncbi:MAG: type II toxin-antitoxin system HicA family toxin [Trichodesmium sp. St18_bin1]|jgi:predicted RNA binding protein YcfA (HicA-like mRNA interferase family)|nr:type II toxin-antitoxin system HicA family toxin [Trichodesmium sp. St18_bin1]MDE5123903.1 type II toxin-antitoxin system HicA family toxin [Trichodesmium sp. St19_bin1]